MDQTFSVISPTM